MFDQSLIGTRGILMAEEMAVVSVRHVHDRMIFPEDVAGDLIGTLVMELFIRNGHRCQNRGEQQTEYQHYGRKLQLLACSQHQHEDQHGTSDDRQGNDQ